MTFPAVSLLVKTNFGWETPLPEGEFKNGSRRREEADFGTKNTSAS